MYEKRLALGIQKKEKKKEKEEEENPLYRVRACLQMCIFFLKYLILLLVHIKTRVHHCSHYYKTKRQAQTIKFENSFCSARPRWD